MFRKLRRAEEHHRSCWIQSATLNKNHLSLHNQQRRECPSFWLDGHLPPSGNHTILLLEWIPHFNFPNSVIHDQVPFPDLLRTTKRFLWLLWPLPAIFSSTWKEFSPSLIALNLLSSAFRRCKLKVRAKVETTTTWSFLFEKRNLDGLTRAPVLSVLSTKS